MFPTARAAAATRASAAPAAIAAALAAVVALSGCSVVRSINNVRHGIDSNRAAIKTFTQGLKTGESMAFSATYVTTGSSPTKIVYSVQPPHQVSFMQTGTGSDTSSLDLVSNSSGEYSCTSATGNSGWTCMKLGRAQAIAQNELVSLYTPSHWITFLETFSVAAGFAGDKVTNSTRTVNGISMHCVDFSAKGVQGRSTICSTPQNILGYVKVAGNPTRFELKTYSASPSAALFKLPPGAKVTQSN
ncbi:MAG TPA: hypothetical protein VGM14_09190 [Streptosporangiaceae bacterium]|jgi:hypothetical protein